MTYSIRIFLKHLTGHSEWTLCCGQREGPVVAEACPVGVPAGAAVSRHLDGQWGG